MLKDILGWFVMFFTIFAGSSTVVSLIALIINAKFPEHAILVFLVSVVGTLLGLVIMSVYKIDFSLDKLAKGLHW